MGIKLRPQTYSPNEIEKTRPADVPSSMGTSSYDQIYARILKHPKMQQFLDSVKRQVDSIQIDRYDFRVEPVKEFGQRAEVTPRFHVSQLDSTTTTGQVYISRSHFITKDEVNDIVRQLFGKPGGVPTYGCSLDVVTGVKTKKYQSFYNFVLYTTDSDLEEHFTKAKEKVARDIERLQQTEEFLERKQAFLIRSAIDNIKLVVKSYAFLGNDILKTAIDEFICHDIFNL